MLKDRRHPRGKAGGRSQDEGDADEKEEGNGEQFERPGDSQFAG